MSLVEWLAVAVTAGWIAEHIIGLFRPWTPPPPREKKS